VHCYLPITHRPMPVSDVQEGKNDSAKGAATCQRQK